MRRLMTRLLPLLTALTMAAPTALANPQRPFTEETVYFVVTDRFANGDMGNDTGGIRGGPSDHGFDPADIGMFQGGDFKGLTARLDYIQGLGATAIWVTPAVTNKPVQAHSGGRSAGYHGYWATDFLKVDPHLGGNGDFKAFVEAAHARGMKVILDIVVNHTADVIQYRECPVPGECPYRSKGDYPAAGYVPQVPAAERAVKNPAWLNDPTHYHNRGDSLFHGESSLLGDFFGLDDLNTEQPAVIEGLIDIYKHWISTYRVDGFRLDTARHVGPAFWHRFIPAITAHAKAEGIPDFFIFGEVADINIAALAGATHESRLPSVLDFAFFQASIDMLALGKGTVGWEALLRGDALYAEGAAATLTTFISNHDHGRMAYLIRKHNPDMPADQVQARVALGYALMFLGRGVPVIYYGDEQGFMGLGDDKQARQPMFASPTRQYREEERLSPTVARGGDSYDRAHPLYRAITELATLRRDHPTLRQGRTQIRYVEEKGGLLVFSRIAEDQEYLIAINAGDTVRSLGAVVEEATTPWQAVRGSGCSAPATAPTAQPLSVPALDYVVCRRSLAAG
ncbi:alpha-amylase family glycosyl hydrolase [Niveispirillum irakense]|uniref:alpha-amylase family glycosyl hydrolase n=1 Tax=Niveispirillum irakense TaxID=34011 RepID=UPI000411D0FC|nr:alpha-amylase family glycosyl hydrolase [Niveispirillum irakense]